MMFRCSNCDSVLHNRRRVTCELCGAIIPAQERVTAAQRAAIDLLEKIERQQRPEFMNRDFEVEDVSAPDGVRAGC